MNQNGPQIFSMSKTAHCKVPMDYNGQQIKSELKQRAKIMSAIFDIHLLVLDYVKS